MIPRSTPSVPAGFFGSPRDLGLRPGCGAFPGPPGGLSRARRPTASLRRPPRRPSSAALRGAGLRGPQREGCPDPASRRRAPGYTSRTLALMPGQRRRPAPLAAPPRGPQPGVALGLRAPTPAAPRRRPRRRSPPPRSPPVRPPYGALPRPARASSGGPARPAADSAHKGPPRARPLPGSRRARKPGAGAAERAPAPGPRGQRPKLAHRGRGQAAAGETTRPSSSNVGKSPSLSISHSFLPQVS